MQSVNFERWLTRLGLKTGAEPPVLQSIQPVTIVADHRQLVSPALDPSGVFGCDMAGVAAVTPNVLIWGPNPVWIHAALASPQTGQIFFVIGQNGTALPVLGNPVDLVRQDFRPGGFTRARRGEGANVPTQDVPCIRVGSAFSIFPPPIFKPAGGWVLFTHNATAANLEVAFWVYEHPNELAE